MSGEDDDGALRDLINRLDGDRSLCLEVRNDVWVVDDFMLHVHRRAVPLKRDLDDIHGAHDPRTKTPWSGQKDLQRTSFLSGSPVGPGVHIAERSVVARQSLGGITVDTQELYVAKALMPQGDPTGRPSDLVRDNPILARCSG